MPKLILAILVSVLTVLHAGYALSQEQVDQNKKPSIEISEDVGDAMVRQAEEVKEQFQEKAKSLFKREPLGWDLGTLDFLYQWVLTLPLKLPKLLSHVYEQSRLLGFVGSMLVLTFLVAVFYSLFGQRHVMGLVQAKVAPVEKVLPDALYPFVLSTLRVVIAALLPLLLLGIFALINAMISYDAKWFQLLGRYLRLWSVGALLMG